MLMSINISDDDYTAVKKKNFTIGDMYNTVDGRVACDIVRGVKLKDSGIYMMIDGVPHEIRSVLDPFQPPIIEAILEDIQREAAACTYPLEIDAYNKCIRIINNYIGGKENRYETIID